MDNTKKFNKIQTHSRFASPNAVYNTQPEYSVLKTKELVIENAIQQISGKISKRTERNNVNIQ
jgi:hypothetical protein